MNELDRPRHHFLVVSLIALTVCLGPIMLLAGVIDAIQRERGFEPVVFILATYLWVFILYLFREKMETDSLSWHFGSFMLVLGIGCSWFYVNDPLSLLFIITAIPVTSVLLGWRGAVAAFCVALVGLIALGWAHLTFHTEAFELGYWVSTSVSCLVVGTILGAVSAKLHDAVRVVPDPQIIRDRERERELEAQLQLAERDRALGALTAAVAHDFNNLLTPIISNAAFAHESTEDPDVQAGLSAIMLASNEARELVRTLLDFQRDDSSEEPLDVGAVVESLCDLLKHDLPDGVEFEADIETGLFAMTRRSDIQRIAMNLVTNAREAVGHEGRIEIRVRKFTLEEHANESVRIGTLEEDEDYVVIEVDDDGCGISPEAMEDIFEPFVTHSNGTGLGLATVREIVLEHRGAIHIESELAVGTTFRIMFPRYG